MLQRSLEPKQFTSEAFTGLLKQHGIAISIDGKGTWRDNVFVERLWLAIKYDEVYFKAYENVRHARESLARFIAFYKAQRPHLSLDGKTPGGVLFRDTGQ